MTRQKWEKNSCPVKLQAVRTDEHNDAVGLGKFLGTSAEIVFTILSITTITAYTTTKNRSAIFDELSTLPGNFCLATRQKLPGGKQTIGTLSPTELEVGTETLIQAAPGRFLPTEALVSRP